ncbi:GPO family capsid scaffolding protein, partial [Serratia fonticola]
DVHEAVTAVVEQVQASGESTAQRFSALEQEIAGLKTTVEAGKQAFATLKTTLDNTESLSQSRRPAATGGEGEESLLTNC